MTRDNLEFLDKHYQGYLDNLKQIGRQKAFLNYFFITINIVIIYTGYFVVPESIRSVLTFLIVLLTGVVLCLYWSRELREILLVEQTLSQILLESELMLMRHKFQDDGEQLYVYKKLWDRLGSMDFNRHSPTSSGIFRSLPLTFTLIHLVNFGLIFLQMVGVIYN